MQLPSPCSSSLCFALAVHCQAVRRYALPSHHNAERAGAELGAALRSVTIASQRAAMQCPALPSHHCVALLHKASAARGVAVHDLRITMPSATMQCIALALQNAARPCSARQALPLLCWTQPNSTVQRHCCAMPNDAVPLLCRARPCLTFAVLHSGHTSASFMMAIASAS